MKKIIIVLCTLMVLLVSSPSFSKEDETTLTVPTREQFDDRLSNECSWIIEFIRFVYGMRLDGRDMNFALESSKNIYNNAIKEFDADPSFFQVWIMKQRMVRDIYRKNSNGKFIRDVDQMREYARDTIARCGFYGIG
jgi:hypothetical protein